MILVKVSRVFPIAEDLSGHSLDLQRKFQPEQQGGQSAARAWREALMCSLPPEVADEPGGEPRRRQSIVVVASLLDRVPNLAGLTRTCEVFGAETLVVSDLSVVKHPDFVGISVTAERHVDMRVLFCSHATDHC